MSCLERFLWTKLPHSVVPACKGILGHWAHLAAHAADHGVDRTGKSAADETAHQRAEDQAVGRGNLADNENDRDGKPDQSAESRIFYYVNYFTFIFLC